VPKRFDLTRKGWRSDLNRFDEETAEVTLNYWNQFFKGAPGHGNEPHDTVQLRTSENICKKFTEILRKKLTDTESEKYKHIFGESGNPNMLPYYLKDKIEEKIIGF